MGKANTEDRQKVFQEVQSVYNNKDACMEQIYKIEHCSPGPYPVLMIKLCVILTGDITIFS